MMAFFKVRNVQRFWSKVEKMPAGCWLWRGGLSAKGYGVHYARGRTWLVHRFAYELEICHINGGDVIQTCDNRLCVNPAHLDYVSSGVVSARPVVTPASDGANQSPRK